jgi:hypothetical protein
MRNCFTVHCKAVNFMVCVLYLKFFKKKSKEIEKEWSGRWQENRSRRLGMVAYAYNPNHSGGRDQED